MRHFHATRDAELALKLIALENIRQEKALDLHLQREKPVKYEVHMSARGLLWGGFLSLILWAVLLGMLAESLKP